MAAMMIVIPIQEAVGVGVAAGADDVMDARAIGVEAVPAERVMRDGRHRPQIGQGAPEPGAGGHMRCIERPRLAAEEALGEIRGVPQIEVADLRAFDADDAEKMPGGYVKSPRFARRRDDLADLRDAGARVVVERSIIGGQPVERVDHDGFRCAALIGVYRRIGLKETRHDRRG